MDQTDQVCLRHADDRSPAVPKWFVPYRTVQNQRKKSLRQASESAIFAALSFRFVTANSVTGPCHNRHYRNTAGITA